MLRVMYKNVQMPIILATMARRRYLSERGIKRVCMYCVYVCVCVCIYIYLSHQIST